MTSLKILSCPWKDIEALQDIPLTFCDKKRLQMLKTTFGKWYRFNLRDSFLTSNTDIKTYYRQKWLVGYIVKNQHPKYEVSLKGGVTLTLERDKLVTLSPLSPKSRKEEIRKGVVKEWMDKIEYNEVC